jgi:hypothetical protein
MGSKRSLAITAVAVGSAVLTNLYLHGLGPLARMIALLIALALLIGGFWTLAATEYDLPLWLRSRRWAKREIALINEDSSHRLYKPYWRKADGYEGISDREHERAVAFMAALRQKVAREGRRKRS